MPVFINWLLRLIPTNPICMRLIQGGSRRTRHLAIRTGYLTVMICVLLLMLMSSVTGALSLRELATAGAQMFNNVSYLQVGLICLLTPVFMAGAISQEANPKTWDILLTTPLNSLQVVLGNLFGRLFFVLALLFSSLPLFAVTQYFGGVPGDSILASYAIAGASALLVATIAVTLSVTRTAGRRAVFIFYISVVLYLTVTFALDIQLRRLNPVTAAGSAYLTTVMTPINPFLALEVLLRSNTYVPHDLAGTGAGWLKRMWLSRPIATFCWLCFLISFFLIGFSTLRARVIGAKVGAIPWYRKLLGLAGKDAQERPPRRVANNPISWREASNRGRSLGALLAKWGFVALGVAVAVVLVTLYHTGKIGVSTLKLSITSVLLAEILIISLVALNMSATAVSREREDGTLDIILTTPIQPGPYIGGKLRGLVQFLLPLMLVPTLTMIIIAIYVLGNGFGGPAVSMDVANPEGAGTFGGIPIVLGVGALALPLVLAPFVAFCVMCGLHWSIRSKGTISSVIGAVTIVVAVIGVISVCLMPTAKGLSVFGAALVNLSPMNLIFALVYPEKILNTAMTSPIGAVQTGILVGAGLSAVAYTTTVYLMHSNMKRTFMMTVRKLAGTN